MQSEGETKKHFKSYVFDYVNPTVRFVLSSIRRESFFFPAVSLVRTRHVTIGFSTL
jgi:hypothetical protein